MSKGESLKAVATVLLMILAYHLGDLVTLTIGYQQWYPDLVVSDSPLEIVRGDLLDRDHWYIVLISIILLCIVDIFTPGQAGYSGMTIMSFLTGFHMLFAVQITSHIEMTRWQSEFPNFPHWMSAIIGDVCFFVVLFLPLILLAFVKVVISPVYQGLMRRRRESPSR